MRYHQLCIENTSLLCFHDNSYLCICDENYTRVECFGYNEDLDRCSSCLNSGQCLKEDQLKSDFVCLCPRCHYGRLCQFNNEGLSFTLDSLLVQVNRIIRIIYLIFCLLLFVIGGISNSGSIITFKRPNLRQSSVGIYVLLFSFISQSSLFALILKMILINFGSLINDISCKILSYMLSVSIRYSLWLTSWIAIERVCYLLFPFATVLKKRRVAIIISLITFIVVGVMHLHELLFYTFLIDSSGESTCVINFSSKITTYNRISVLIHYSIPFFIQILSITILIILAARIGSNRDGLIKYLKRQFRSQKELYLTPTVIVFSGLPQVILSFSFACIELVTWQQHALLFSYFLSYTPQLLAFALFVLPSTNYIKEFRATNLSKTIIFRWILSRKKKNLTTSTKK